MERDIHKLAERYHLNDSEQRLLRDMLEGIDAGVQYSVRELAARHYVSPASVMRLSKKMGYSGYTDMAYRLEFLTRNERENKNHSSDITSFIGDIPEEDIAAFTRLLIAHRHTPILVTGTGFCNPLREFFARKLLVLGFTAIGTNSYEVYENNTLHAGLVIAISKSGGTDTIMKPVEDAAANGVEIISFTGNANSPIAGQAKLSFALLDDKIMDDRNLTANYFYARVLVLFEYLMDEVMACLPAPGERAAREN